MQRKKPVLPDLHKAIGTGGESDDQGAFGRFEIRRQRGARHDRNIRRLDAAVRQIDAGRRLRSAADAEKNDVGFVQVARGLAVIMAHRVVERGDAVEIFRIHDVLQAGLVRGLLAKILPERLHRRIENRNAGRLQLGAAFLETRAQLLIHHREHDETWRVLDFAEHPLELFRAAHQRIDMFDGPRILILGAGRPRDHVQRFACRVGNEMKMEDALAAHVLRPDHPVFLPLKAGGLQPIGQFGLAPILFPQAITHLPHIAAGPVESCD